MRDLWYKDAIVYCLDVDTYMDANGDGIGDFKGLAQRVDHIAGLGATCLWLLPFYPSPNRDDGYDVKDYYAVDPRLGTLGDFVEFIHYAHERGLRVIIDLVVNHTSDQHPWFQAARKDKDSPYRDYYVWSETKPADAEEGVVFPGRQEAIWTYDEEAEAYYFHRFYKHQPDLNIANPAVREEIRKIMGFWLQLGISGFRVDAAPFLIELKGIQNATVKDPYNYLREFREFLQWRRGDAILLAEANVAMDKVPSYFGDGTKLHMLFNFLLNQYLFLALTRKQAAPLIEGLHKLPPLPHTGQWANFLRNHDELNLGRLSKAQREEIFQALAPEKRMQIYGRGIRRRLPPMFDGDQKRIRLAYSLMFSLPGTPVLRYGEEIGMGDDLSLSDRNSVRTPMQWSNEKNGGFSSAPEENLIRPVIKNSQYGYEQLNMIRQEYDPDSLLNWIERLMHTRKENPEFGFGHCRIAKTGDPAVFAHTCEWEEGIVLAVHNLSDQPRTVTLDLSDYKANQLLDILGDHKYSSITNGAPRIELQGYGFRWFQLKNK
ncbi:trehalose synthase [Nitrosococcus wardiae]|uniref:Trehalose synthase n=2 Tax=Nitrosococcus wardiae TaxID=1814290 RepID=A0A4P7C259_9GAMM|nr:trehalose synthase [Nitrosococcus wardiae]